VNIFSVKERKEERMVVRTHKWNRMEMTGELVLRTTLVKERRKRLQDEDAKELFLTLCLKGLSL